MLNRIRTSISHLLGRAKRNGTTSEAQDEGVSWIRFAVAGMLEWGNLAAFEHAVRHLPDNSSIVEIGSFCGLSTNLLAYFKRKHGRANLLFSSEPWMFEGSEKETAPNGSQAYREFVRESFIRNTRFFSRDDLPHTIELLSDDFFARWRAQVEQEDVFGRAVRLGGPIGFAYIDGHHGYDYVRRDFKNVDEFLVPYGLILFDDSAPGSVGEANVVVQEVEASGRYELTMRNPNYLFRKL